MTPRVFVLKSNPMLYKTYYCELVTPDVLRSSKSYNLMDPYFQLGDVKAAGSQLKSNKSTK